MDEASPEVEGEQGDAPAEGCLMSTAPVRPKIYLIVHVYRLSSILSSEGLLSDAEVIKAGLPGTNIGLSELKSRRLNLPLRNTYPDLCVGDCVPFYFCPRSVMLFLLFKGNNPELSYRGGQEPIVHLVADLYDVAAWAKDHGRRWVFTTSNAGSLYFEDFSDLAQLNRIDWPAVEATNWIDQKEGKQAEFLVEKNLPWLLVEEIGTMTEGLARQVSRILGATGGHRPRLAVKPEWYYQGA